MNLLEETKKILNKYNKSLKDIKWVGCLNFKIPTDLFIKLANKEYENGYGKMEVAEDLLVVGNDWWLERHEYDGAEWWEYKEKPEEPKEIKKVFTVIEDEKSEKIRYGNYDDDFYSYNFLTHMRSELLPLYEHIIENNL